MKSDRSPLPNPHAGSSSGGVPKCAGCNAFHQGFHSNELEVSQRSAIRHESARPASYDLVMIETVVYVATSLDGFIARPDGAIDWLPTPPEGEDFGWADFIAGIDAIVMGRKTFEQVLTFGAWPYEGTPLVVMSRTLTELPPQLEGKATLSALEPRVLLEQLETDGHRRVYVDGGSVVQSFLRVDGIDELIVTTVPVLLGTGIPLFGPVASDLSWSLVSSEQLFGGLVQSRYRRNR